MPIREVFLLAFESILGNRLRAGLTMIGVIIGVFAVVLLVSVGQGAKNYVGAQFESLGTNLIIVQPGKTDKRNGFGPPISSAKQKITMADVQALEKSCPNLEAISGLMFSAGAVKNGDRTHNTNIIGAQNNITRILNISINEGRFYTKEEDDYIRRVAIIGHSVAENLFGEDNAIGAVVKVMDSDFRVIGVMKKMGQSLGLNFDDMVIMPTRTAMRLFNEEKLFGLRAKAKSKASVNDAVEEIKQVLIERHNGQEDFTILTQVAMLDSLNTILGMLSIVLAGIAMISMVVGGIGIMNIMLVSVTERTREIGIRRAVGARRKDIMVQFLIEAVILSLLGGLIGLALSVGITYIAHFFAPQFDMRSPGWILAPSFMMSLITGVVFGVWPARQAAKIETIEALRYE